MRTGHEKNPPPTTPTPWPINALLVFLAVAIITLVTRFQPLPLRHSPASRAFENRISISIRHQHSSSKIMAASYQDYLEDDYRAFLFAVHPKYGMLLLHCTRKKNKPPHFQAPGGHM